MKADDALFLADILDEMAFIAEVRPSTQQVLVKDKRTRYAIERSFTIIGEATKRLTPTFTEENPDIPWAGMRGLRNRIAHEYQHLDYETIWEIMETLPDYVPRLSALLQQLQAAKTSDK